MTEAIAFNTHKFVKHMTEVGFTKDQAEALANAQVNLINSNVATKADIAEIQADIEQLRLATKADIERLRLGTKVDIAELKVAELLRWAIATMIVQTVVIVALIKFA